MPSRKQHGFLISEGMHESGESFRTNAHEEHTQQKEMECLQEWADCLVMEPVQEKEAVSTI